MKDKTKRPTPYHPHTSCFSLNNCNWQYQSQKIVIGMCVRFQIPIYDHISRTFFMLIRSFEEIFKYPYYSQYKPFCWIRDL